MACLPSFIIYAFVLFSGSKCLEIYPMSDYVVKAGASVTLRCSFKSDAITEARWSGGLWSEEKTFQPSNSTQDFEMTLWRYLYLDTVKYTCEVKTATEKLNRSVLLFVLTPPRFDNFPLYWSIYDVFDVYRAVGHIAVLKCQAAYANPVPKWTWKFNNGPLPDYINVVNSKYRAVENGLSTLVIPDVRQRDFGDYTCLAENDQGFDKVTVRLLPLGKPEAPQLSCNLDLGYNIISYDSITCSHRNAVDKDKKVDEYIVYVSLEKDLNNSCCETPNSMKTCGISPKYQKHVSISQIESNATYVLQAIAKNKMGESDISPCTTVSTHGLEERNEKHKKWVEELKRNTVSCIHTSAGCHFK